MFTWLMNALFGTSHERAIRRLIPKVMAINALEPSMKTLADAELRGATAELKTKLGNGALLDDLLLQAFAVCREASRRALDMRHHDVQLIGGMILHEGAIAEMRAGEGKTLVATLAGYLNALEGKGVHVVTVNDYLARRDAERMGKLYDFLGLSTGLVVSQQTDEEKKKAYRCDLTYGPASEIGFDYLRDSRTSLDPRQRPLNYAIVDDADTILLDDARRPLAIDINAEGQGKNEDRPLATTTYQKLFRAYKKLSGMTGTVDTDAPELRSSYQLDVVTLPPNKPARRVDQVDLIFKTEREKITAVVAEIAGKHASGQPILVGTRSVEMSAALSRSLQKKNIEHSVVKAKHPEAEAFVMAQAGRKGAVTIATDPAGRGTDIALGGDPEMLAQLKFKEQSRTPEAEPEAFKALVEELREKCRKEGDEVRALGGLYVLGTERHESLRIDNQLRGRAGRQGDLGRSRFYLSLEDDLMRRFAGDRIKDLMERMGMPDGEPINHPWVRKAFANAQKKFNEQSVELRKSLLAGRDPP